MGPAGLAEAAGVEAVRAKQLCGVAAAALEGRLDAASLAAMGTEEARSLLRTVPGIGVFYADLILVRATGVTDVLPLNEPPAPGADGRAVGPRRPGHPGVGIRQGGVLVAVADVGGAGAGGGSPKASSKT
jgi:DNA-3-methyladenine glycosylase II